MVYVVMNGRLTRDVELRRSGEGKAFAHFTLAVDRSYKNKQGEYDTDFFDCVAIGQKAETISKYVHKGDKFMVCGTLENRSWEKDGRKYKATEVIVDKFDFLERKKQTEDKTESASGGFVPIDVPDEALPF